MGLVKLVAGTCATLATTVLLILFLPNFPPDAEPEAVYIKPPIKFEGWFESNTVLDEAELYYESDSVMESLVLLNDNSFISGDQHGNIVKVVAKQHAVNLTKLKFPCGDAPQEVSKGKTDNNCGWPLGMRIAKNGHLYLMDFYGGVVRVDMKTGKYEAIVPKSQPVNGKSSSYPEDLDVALDGTVYWSDGSSIEGNGEQEFLAGPSGRLIKYDPVTRKNEVLVDKIYFSNGVCLSSDEKFVLVADLMSSRIIRYHLAGKKKGESDIFVDGLPGYPDNIRSNGRGGFYVPLALPWNEQFSLNAHILGPRPLLRKFLLRTGYVIVQSVSYLKKLFPDNVYLDVVEKYFTSLGYIFTFEKMPRIAQVVELSSTGEIIGVLNAKRGEITGLSQVVAGKEYAFLNSFFDKKIWRVKLDALRKSS